MQRGKPVPVEPFLHACNALIVDIDMSDQMGNFRAVGVCALVLAEETDAGQPHAIDVALLFGRDVAFEPGKAAL